MILQKWLIKVVNSLTRKKEGDMAELVCAWCGYIRTLANSPNVIRREDKADIIRGTLICHRCEKETVFGMTGNAISFYPTKDAYGELSPKTQSKVVQLFRDAEKCYYGTGFRGAIAMCRACVEEALEQMKVKPNKLEDMINEAQSKGILTQTECMLAHGSRLAGNAALHKADSLEPANIPAVLSATVAMVNHLFQ